MSQTTHKKRDLAIVAAVMVALLALASTAFAGSLPLISNHATPGLQPMIFGGPGAQPSLAPNCARKQMWITPAGKVWSGAAVDGKKYVFAISTVMGGQIKCLIHRVDVEQQPDTCFTQAGPVPATSEAPADKQGYHDTTGLNALRAWATKLSTCEANRA